MEAVLNYLKLHFLFVSFNVSKLCFSVYNNHFMIRALKRTFLKVFNIRYCRERARTQAPTTRNCTVELPTFVVIAGVSPGEVQCKSLTLEEAPS